MSLHGINTTSWKFGRVLLAGAPSEHSEVTLAYTDVPPAASPAKGPLLLIHGFPQTSHQFRHVLNPLSAQGYRVIAPDYRGAGQSSRPVGGYDKVTMATDLHTLLRSHLNVKDKVHVIGHDIGGMVAHAYAAHFASDVASVVHGECPLPGSSVYEKFKNAPVCWHFTFHNQLDLPELLVADHEREYLEHFYTRLCVSHAAMTEADKAVYVEAYKSSGGFRAGFNTYRAFAEDSQANQIHLEKNGKSKVPCCALSGKASAFSGENARTQSEEFYENVVVRDVEGSGHWIAEEQPEGFVKSVVDFVSRV
ncbi:MAG: hypothetical protein Q9162_006667 [Coniocarpon cinnabarinum]